MIHGSKEQIEYGQRSKYVTSCGQHPIAAGRHPTCVGKVFTWPRRCRILLRDHAIFVALYSDDPRSFLPDIDPSSTR